jgi:hypothetical protein
MEVLLTQHRQQRPNVVRFDTRLPTTEDVETFLKAFGISLPDAVRTPSWKAHKSRPMAEIALAFYGEEGLTLPDFEPFRLEEGYEHVTPFEVVAIVRLIAHDVWCHPFLVGRTIVGLGELCKLDPPPSEYRYALSAYLSDRPTQHTFAWVSGPQGWNGSNTCFTFMKL